MSADIAAVDGFEVESSGETPEQIVATFKAMKDAEASQGDPTVRKGGTSGSESPGSVAKSDPARERDEAGKFKGNGKPAEEPEAADEEPAKEAKPDEKKAKAKPEADEEAEEPPKPAKKDHKGNPRHDPSARVAQLARETRQAREETARLRAEIDQLRSGKPAPQKAEQADDGEDPKPKAADFEDYDSYLDARDEWTTRRAVNQFRTEQAQKDRAAKRATYAREADDAITAAGGDEFVSNLNPRLLDGSYTPISDLPEGVEPTAKNALGELFILAGKHSPALLRYLSENEDVLDRHDRIETPLELERERGRLEEAIRLTQRAAKTATAPRVDVSQAKPPLRPVKGGANFDSGDDEIPDDADLTSFIRARERQDARARR